MFEQPEPSRSSRPLRILAFSALGILVGIGFCGLDAHLYPHSELGGSFLAVLGAGLGFAGVIAGLGAALTLIGQAIAGFFRR